MEISIEEVLKVVVDMAGLRAVAEGFSLKLKSRTKRILKSSKNRSAVLTFLTEVGRR